MKKSSIDLPYDVYQNIVAHTSSASDLASLCRTSRAFHYEAERILYHHIKVCNEQIELFCEEIMQNSRLASIVRGLSLRLDSYAGSFEDEERHRIFKLICHALQTLTSLVSLEVIGSAFDYYSLEFRNIFFGCTFNLLKFSSSLKVDKYLVIFLLSQPNIRHWKSTVLYGAMKIPEGIPSQLMVVEGQTCFLNRLGKRRHITHIRLLLHPFSNPVAWPTQLLSSALLSISLHILPQGEIQKDMQHWASFCETMSQYAPNVKFLEIWRDRSVRPFISQIYYRVLTIYSC